MKWYEHPSWRIIEASQRREWQLAYQWLVGGSIVAALFSLVVAWPYKIGLIALAGIGLVGMIRLSMSKNSWFQSSLLNRLRHHPDTVCWLYALRFQQMPLGFFLSERCRIVIGFSDGKKEDLYLLKTEYRAVMLLLQRISPHARVGWSDEIQQEFEKDPVSLLKNQGKAAR
jgi:hypothetical protein